MIAIDTNVVLRYVLNDDKAQARKAAALIRRHKQVLITDIVLAETVWTLKGRRYKLDRTGICKVVNALFAETSIHFEDNQVVWRALNDFIGAIGLPDTPKSKGEDQHRLCRCTDQQQGQMVCRASRPGTGSRLYF